LESSALARAAAAERRTFATATLCGSRSFISSPRRFVLALRGSLETNDLRRVEHAELAVLHV
jgi:hypothetical protein